VLWGFTWLVGASRTPEQFLQDLSSSNTEVKWRAASDLAQVLKKDEALASNPKFALDLADLLNQTLRDREQAEKRFNASGSERLARVDRDRDTLQAEARFVQYLINCLGNFNLPVGVPLLCQIAVSEDGADARSIALWRGAALWSLASLGDRLKHLDEIPAAKRDEIMEVLDTEAANAPTERGERARRTREYLKHRFSGQADVMEVDQALAHCAESRNPGLRNLTAFALNIWEGDPEANKRMERALLSLSYDDGHGLTETLQAVPDDDGQVIVDADEKTYRLRIRYKAVEGLARRGSDKLAKRWGVLEEMLDESRLAENFRIKLVDGRNVPDETAVDSTLTGALRAVAEGHRRRPKLDFSRFDVAIARLADNPNAAVRAEAQRTQITLFNK
jgi:hypothetical protein